MNFIDIFSGAGGFSCGLEMAKHRCLLGIDHDKDSIQTFQHNHKMATIILDDIKKIKISTIKERIQNRKIHLIVGGPPCQGFSTIGLGDPEDHRNRLFLEFLRIVKEIRPYYIVIENVTGLLAVKNKNLLNILLKKFKIIGYHLDVKILSSHHYGVPEIRRRTIIIGSRLHSQIIFPKMTHEIYKDQLFIPAVTLKEAFANIKGHMNHDLQSTKLRSIKEESRLRKIPEGKGIRYEKDELAYLPPGLRLGIQWSKLPENRLRQMKYQRLNRNLPAPTIVTNRYTYYHPTEDRCLTQREAAALQSFPNDFLFYGSVTGQWKQIGNAVPPLLGRAIGKSIQSMFRKYSKTK